MEINILIDKKFSGKLNDAWVRQIVGSVLTAENASPHAEVGVVITDQATIRRLNKTYLDEDETTDVLSFSMLEEAAGRDVTSPFVSPPDNLVHLGEVLVSYPQAVLQAARRRYPVKREVAILLIHGMLHLLGLDHDTAEHRRTMTDRENKILGMFEEKLSFGE